MGIHISCDRCYKSVEEGQFVTLTTSSDNNRYPLKHKSISCFPCMKSNQYIYMHIENPNYIPMPEVVSDEAKPAS